MLGGKTPVDVGISIAKEDAIACMRAQGIVLNAKTLDLEMKNLYRLVMKKNCCDQLTCL